MLFTTLQFCQFLVVVLALFYAIPQSWRRFLLLAASIYFYLAWIPVFIVLIFSLVTIDFIAGLWIESRQGRQRSIALVISLAANIGLLGWFKYANFLRETWMNVVHPGTPFTPWSIILPLGISF